MWLYVCDGVGQVPGEFDSVVQGCRQQQAVVLSVEGQAPDLFTVDGNVLTRLHVYNTHLFHPTA